MRIAYLCKRRYMGKDVIVDRYARLYEIPFQLARLGHDVAGYCLGYHREREHGDWLHEATPGTLAWHSQALGPGTLAYPWHLLRRLREFAPDLLVAASDIPHVALGGWLARRLRVPFVADLYDNFEGFGQARIPGMVAALRHAVRGADLLLTTSEPLRELVVHGYRARGEVIAMPSTVDKAVFHPRERDACREALGLPRNALLVGTAGGLYRDKGIEALYAAWARLRVEMPQLHLVLAGPHEAGLPPPNDDRVHYLGALPHAQVAQLFCALDVGAICILDTAFGRYCFPQKAYEMLACNLPVVAADVGAMGALFADTPQCLYAAGDAADLATKLHRQAMQPMRPDIEIEDWQQIIDGLEARLSRLVAR